MKNAACMQTQKRQARRLIPLFIVALVVYTGLTGCAADQAAVSGGSASAPVVEAPGATVPSAGKIRIDFEGTVVSVGEGCVQLDTGQTVALTSETVFTDYTGVLESPQLSAGAIIQGSTADDPSAAEITASRVHVVALP